MPSSEPADYHEGTPELGSYSRQKDSVNPLNKESDTSPVLPTPEKHDTWHVDKNDPRLQSIDSEIDRLYRQIANTEDKARKDGKLDWSGYDQLTQTEVERLKERISDLWRKYEEIKSELASAKQSTGDVQRKMSLPISQTTETPKPTKEDPMKVLKLRFAKGEITKEEFLDMKSMLE